MIRSIVRYRHLLLYTSIIILFKKIIIIVIQRMNDEGKQWIYIYIYFYSIVYIYFLARGKDRLLFF
jgi:hypothetical protein